jgi:hypothetical protein
LQTKQMPLIELLGWVAATSCCAYLVVRLVLWICRDLGASYAVFAVPLGLLLVLVVVRVRRHGPER